MKQNNDLVDDKIVVSDLILFEDINSLIKEWLI